MYHIRIAPCKKILIIHYQNMINFTLQPKIFGTNHSINNCPYLRDKSSPWQQKMRSIISRESL